MRLKEGVSLDKVPGAYFPEDWVVLGKSGAGWASYYEGKVVQIADIGPHLVGRLYSRAYDFYVFPNPTIEPNSQIARNPDETRMSGGNSANILRHATVSEIQSVKRRMRHTGT
jgi:hypothetical protein